MLDSTNKTTTTKPVSSPRTDAIQAYRAMAENGSAQAREAFEKMSAARPNVGAAPSTSTAIPCRIFGTRTWAFGVIDG
jgi:hypothetical protein